MSSVQQRLSSDRLARYGYFCRVCKGKHGLKDCKDFIDMDVNDRIRFVISHRYCPNCLAHKHSAGSCFSSKGCKHCAGNHHTLLHLNNSKHKPEPKYTAKRNNSKKSKQASSRTLSIVSRAVSTNRIVSMTSIASLHSTILFPTAIVLVINENKRHHVRAVIDTCTAISKISKQLVHDLQLPTTTLGDETICAVTICSRQPPKTTLESTMKVNNHITMSTPNKSIDASIVAKFSNLVLADPKFYESTTLAIVLGADLYGKIVQTGLLPSSAGLPVAMNTIFGWVLSGSCAS